MKGWRILWLVPLLAATGCGYHTAGHSVQLPENVKTIAIPAFTNVTTTYRIEQMLTASVVREFITRTHYHILNEPGEAADATLRGTVISTSQSPLTYNSTTGPAGQSALSESVILVSRTIRSFAGPGQLLRGRHTRLPPALSGFRPNPGL
jgi:hypothetical protein